MRTGSDNKTQESTKETEWSKGLVGRSRKTARRSTKAEEEELDDALGLTPITLRLQKTLVEELKLLAKEDGLGYQPFVRQILTQYAKTHRKSAAVV